MKNLTFLKIFPIAHRGLFDNIKIPENSLEAFKIAIKNNNAIELDVHLTKDKNIIVFHDDNIQRMTYINKNIHNISYNEIKNIKLLNTNYNIPLLKDVLKTVNGKVPLIIELKTDNKVGILEKELVKLLDNYKGDFSIKSFSTSSIKWFKRNRPNYIRGILIRYKEKNIKDYILNHLLFNLICKPDFISCNYKLLSKHYINKYKNKKVILAWGVTNQKLNSKLYDNIIYKKRIK